MASATDTITAIVKDPALPALLKQIAILRDLEVADQSPSSPTTNVPDTGLGLHRVVRALDAYLWFRQNRWIAAVAVGGIIFVPGIVGFVLGRASAGSRSKAPSGVSGAAPFCIKRKASTHQCLEWSDGYRPLGGTSKSKKTRKKTRRG